MACGRTKDLTGQRFGRLTVICRTENGGDEKPRWLCKCDCGNTKTVRSDSLTKPNGTKSCGCLWREVMIKANTKHGYSTRYGDRHIRNIWHGMLDRCEKQHSSQFYNYGARGITVCAEWHDLKTFGDWAKENGCKDGLQIDRIDNDKGYYPGNCRFVLPVVNANNKRCTVFVEINGETISLRNAARKYNCPWWRIVNRMKAGKTGFDLVKERC